MRNIICLVFLLVCVTGKCFGQLQPKVDERIELTGVVFRIAGVPEYTYGVIEEYNKDIDEYFQSYSHHDLIDYIIKLRNEDRLGYAAVAASIGFICIGNGKVSLNQHIPVSKLPGLGEQWRSEKVFRKYVELLNDFYVKTNFQKFYNDHKPLYEKAETCINQLLADFNFSWFSNFFGGDFISPAMYVALGNGPSNYYIMDYESKAGYSIIIGGKLNYTYETTLPMVIHEICHNYTNPLFYKYWSKMEFSANAIYDEIADDMRENAYGNVQESLLEWLNNLFSIMYLRDNEPGLVDYIVGILRDRGFIWMPRSVQFMEYFYQNRGQYPHIDSFMPQVVDFFNYTSSDFDRIKFETQNNHPYVRNIFPANGSNIYNGNFRDIQISFSQPMLGSYCIDTVKDDPTITDLPRAQIRQAYWIDDYTLSIPLDCSQIEKNKKYGLVLRGNGYATKDYVYMNNDYTIIYNTTQQ